MEDQVLNKFLYKRLKTVTGNQVRVENRGQGLRARNVVSGLTGIPKLVCTQKGEYYRIDCPFCSDTKKRLYVNHAWGTKLEERRLNFLVVCFNEDCLSLPVNSERFFHMIYSNMGRLENVRVLPGITVSDEARVMTLPGDVVPLSSLPEKHTAIQYVRSRWFNPKELSDIYQVGYCNSSHFSLARHRLILPIYFDGELRGWQSRHVGELPWKDKVLKKNLPPKYFTAPGADKSKLIGNYDNASKCKTIVLVEGWFDAYRQGVSAGVLFGKTVSDYQFNRIVTDFGQDRTVVLMLDPEEFGSRTTREICMRFQTAMAGQFAAVCLPAGKDPGKLSRKFLHGFIKQEAAKQEVEVSFDYVESVDE